MKSFFAYLGLFAVTQAAHLNNAYLPPFGAASSGGSGSFIATPFATAKIAPIVPAPSAYYGGARSYSAEGGAQIQAYSSDNDGSAYHYAYDTSNGISVQEQGQARVPGPEGPAVAAQGSFSYVSPEGEHVSLEYTADENGFHPRGSHLPTPPPIPEAILRSLQITATAVPPSSVGYAAKTYIPPVLPVAHVVPSFNAQTGYHY